MQANHQGCWDRYTGSTRSEGGRADCDQTRLQMCRRGGPGVLGRWRGECVGGRMERGCESKSWGGWQHPARVGRASSSFWAVGSSTTSPGPSVTLIERHTASGWVVTPSPNPGPSAANNSLAGVAVLSSTNVWAVGSETPDPHFGNDLTLIEHWNGSSWTVSPSPNPSSTSDDLVAVSAITAKNIWAVGSR
jgi:hypothetical protein